MICGDSTDADTYASVLGEDIADMVFTDPPYNVNYANSAKDKMRGKNRAILNDNLGDGFYDFLLAALTPTLAHCRGGSTWPCHPANSIPCSPPSGPPVAIGQPSSSGPRILSPWVAPTTSASTNRYCTAARRRERHWCGDRTRGMSGRSRSQPRTICIRP